MNQDTTGFYDVYGPLAYPWWKTPFFYTLISCALIMFLLIAAFIFYKFLYKKNVLTDLEQLVLYRTLLDKSQDSAIILYDYVIRVVKILFLHENEKSSFTTQELVFLVKNCHNEKILDNSSDQLISILTNAERVRFGKESIVWSIVYDDVDYVIAMAKKNQSITTKK